MSAQQSSRSAGEAGRDARRPPSRFPVRAILRQWIVFVSIIAAFAALHEWASFWVNTQFAVLTAHLTAFLLSLLGANAQASGTLVSSSHCVFEIIGECTAYYPIAVFVAAVLAYPCRISRRLWGVALGVPALLLVNQVRLVSLCYVYRWFRDDFETIHILVWQSLIMFLTVLLWVIWVATFARDDEPRPA